MLKHTPQLLKLISAAAMECLHIKDLLITFNLLVLTAPAVSLDTTTKLNLIATVAPS